MNVSPSDVGIHIPPGLQGRPSVRAACPKCARERDDALHVNFDADGAWVAFCHRCHTAFSSGLRARRDIARPSPPTRPALRTENITATWRRLPAWRGTIVEDYLRNRTRTLPPDDADLRFEPRAWHPIEKRNLPAMAALVTHAFSGEPLTLHRTFLRSDGSGKADVAKPKLLAAGLPKKHGVVRLWHDITTVLGVAEGIETTVAASHGFAPMWACLDCGNLASMPLIDGIGSLLIAADHDEAGLKAANDLARRWTRAGRDVRISYPPAPGQDFADTAVQS